MKKISQKGYKKSRQRSQKSYVNQIKPKGNMELGVKCWKKYYYQVLNNTYRQLTERILEFIDIFLKDMKMSAFPPHSQYQDDLIYPKYRRNAPKRKTIEKKNKKKNLQDQNQNQTIPTQNRKNILFIPLCIQKKQQEYILDFIKTFKTYLQYFNRDLQNNFYQRYSSIISARQINLFQNPECQNMGQILVYMLQMLTKINIEGDISIYITNNIVQWSQENILSMEASLGQTGCVIIVPTYHNFQQIEYNKFKKSQILPLKLFDDKNLYQDLLYSCIADCQIKLYLPKESLTLLNDFDNCSMTLRQGTTRLAHIIQRLQYLRKNRDVQFKFIQISNLFKAIQAALSKVFIFFNDKYTNKQKYIKCILDQSQPFNILDRYLTLNIFCETQYQSNLNKNQLINKLRKSLIRYIERDESIEHYSSYFKQTKININSLNDLDQKQILQLQMKSAISKCTSQIKRQGNFFIWQHYYKQLA